MYNLAELYYPITARPDSAGELMPCKALQPYIRCYWGSMGECGAAPGERSVMPDKLSDNSRRGDHHSRHLHGYHIGMGLGYRSFRRRFLRNQ